MAPFDDKYMTSYMMTIVMFALSLIVCKIFSNQDKCKILTLKMKVKFKEEKNGTCAVSPEMFDSI